jgi:hypothetical protein
MPGIAEEILGAMQHAPHCDRQFIAAANADHVAHTMHFSRFNLTPI